MQHLTIYSITASVLCLCAVLLYAPLVRAHSNGSSFESIVGSYEIDVGYEPENITAGANARFDFSLRKESSGDEVNFDHVWIRITEGGRTLLATGIRRQFMGPTILLYSFQKGGSYSLEVSYRNQVGNEIAVAAFPIAVSDDSRGGSINDIFRLVLSLVGGLAFGGVIAALLIRRRSGL